MMARKKGQQWIAVCGTKDFNEPQLLYEKMDFYVSNFSIPPVILIGGCKQRVFKTLNSYLYVGTDYFVEMWAYTKKLTVRIHRPDFNSHNTRLAALEARNREMIQEASSLIVFGIDKENKVVIELAKEKKISVKIVKY